MVYIGCMSNLAKCKDCGHTVSKKAKVCPSCGVGKPGVPPTDIGRLIVISVVIVFGGIAYFNYLNGIDELVNGTYTPTATTIRTFTEAEIQEAIFKSDDYETHRAMFTKAATYLLTTSRCTQREMKDYGGFVKAQGENRFQPIYFTYCGGMTKKNRLYVDADTGKVYK